MGKITNHKNTDRPIIWCKPLIIKSPILRRINTLGSRVSLSRFKLHRPRTWEYLIYTARCMKVRILQHKTYSRRSFQHFKSTSRLNTNLIASSQIISWGSPIHTPQTTHMNHISFPTKLDHIQLWIRCLLFNIQTSQICNFNNPRQTLRYKTINKITRVRIKFPKINPETNYIPNKEKSPSKSSMANRYSNNRGRLLSPRYIRWSIFTKMKKFT